jgi:ERCC4-type nuclease
MRLVIDVREHELIDVCKKMIEKEPGNVSIETESLAIGDILIKTNDAEDGTGSKEVLIIERKTLTDLISSIKDGRYEEQSHRLKHASGFQPHNIIYMIEGMYSTLKLNTDKKLVMSTITSLNFFKGFSVMRTCSIYETAETLIHMASKIENNFLKGICPLKEPCVEETSYTGFVKKVKKENITNENIEEIMLSQIPGISTPYAKSILTHFGGFLNLLEQVNNNTASFREIVYQDGKGKSRKLPKTCEEQIIKLLKNGQ